LSSEEFWNEPAQKDALWENDRSHNCHDYHRQRTECSGKYRSFYAHAQPLHVICNGWPHHSLQTTILIAVFCKFNLPSDPNLQFLTKTRRKTFKLAIFLDERIEANIQSRLQWEGWCPNLTPTGKDHVQELRWELLPVMFLENILRWQGIVEQNISSVLQPAHSKSLISRGLIIYIYLDRQTCQIEMITCRINKAGQARVPATIRREPMILSLLSVAAADVWLSLADWWCGDQNMWTIGPLYIVISIAPPYIVQRPLPAYRHPSFQCRSTILGGLHHLCKPLVCSVDMIRTSFHQHKSFFAFHVMKSHHYSIVTTILFSRQYCRELQWEEEEPEDLVKLAHQHVANSARKFTTNLWMGNGS